MMRRDFLSAIPVAAFVPASAFAAVSANFTPLDPMVGLIDMMGDLSDAFEGAPDPTGNSDSPECIAISARMNALRGQIAAQPILSAAGATAYCRYLIDEAQCFDIEPDSLTKILTWAEGLPQ